jgi:hypothetical protein
MAAGPLPFMGVQKQGGRTCGNFPKPLFAEHHFFYKNDGDQIPS